MCLAGPVVFDSAKTALEFKYQILIDQRIYNAMIGVGHKLEKWKK